MKASDYIVQFFEGKETNVIFGYIGGMITHLVDSIDKNPNVSFIQTYHEQTAAIAAEGYALASGKPGVAIATSGPGATNLMTGIADAYFGSIPTVFITGQVNTYEYKYDKPIRQQGFQETDVVSIVRPITKYAVMIDDAEDLRYELEKAYHLAKTGRKGPVLIDLPMDISRAEIDPEKLRSFVPEHAADVQIDFTPIKSEISKAKRPLLLIGGGCRGFEREVSDYVRKTDLPFVTSLMGRGIADESGSNYVGMIGSYGNRCANIVISQCDLLIALGTRLDTRQTGAKIESFMPKGKIIHVDIDKAELTSHRLTNRLQIHASVSQFISRFEREKIMFNHNDHWLKWIRNIVFKYSQVQEVDRFVQNKAPYRFLEIFNKISEQDSIITTDIGQNQMWAAQTIKLKNGQQFFTSGGLAPMGFSLPAAIGAAFANPEKTIYCFNGDGGFHMACQSLLIISQYNLNVKVIIMNNQALGMITQFQHLYFNDRMAGTTAQGAYLTPDIQMMAAAYRIPYQRTSEEDLNMEKLMKSLKERYVIIDYIINGLTTVSPKLEYNQPIHNPSPHLPEQELESIVNQVLE